LILSNKDPSHFLIFLFSKTSFFPVPLFFLIFFDRLDCCGSNILSLLYLAVPNLPNKTTLPRVLSGDRLSFRPSKG
jgi:hypothetical protein